MSEEVKQFIDKMAKNDMVGAGDAFKDALRAKVGDQLDVKRQDVLSQIYKDPDSSIELKDIKPGQGLWLNYNTF